jgi:hypothetical protein
MENNEVQFAKSVFEQYKPVSSPDYYSGIGANKRDLDGRILEGIFLDIERAKGMEAARSFAIMVSEIPELSVTRFLHAFYALAENKWNFKPEIVEPKSFYGIQERGAVEGLCHSLLQGKNKINETADIRKDFLRKHKKLLRDPKQVPLYKRIFRK